MGVDALFVPREKNCVRLATAVLHDGIFFVIPTLESFAGLPVIDFGLRRGYLVVFL